MKPETLTTSNSQATAVANQARPHRETAYQMLKRINKELGLQTNDPKFAPEA